MKKWRLSTPRSQYILDYLCWSLIDNCLDHTEEVTKRTQIILSSATAKIMPCSAFAVAARQWAKVDSPLARLLGVTSALALGILTASTRLWLRLRIVRAVTVSRDILGCVRPTSMMSSCTWMPLFRDRAPWPKVFVHRLDVRIVYAAPRIRKSSRLVCGEVSGTTDSLRLTTSRAAKRMRSLKSCPVALSGLQRRASSSISLIV